MVPRLSKIVFMVMLLMVNLIGFCDDLLRTWSGEDAVLSLIVVF